MAAARAKKAAESGQTLQPISLKNAIDKPKVDSKASLAMVLKLAREKKLQEGGTLNPVGLRPSAPARPSFFVKRWVDYTKKHGIGFHLSDQTCGVFLNDGTKILQQINQPTWQLILRENKKDKIQNYDEAYVPEKQTSNYELLKNFNKYLLKNEGQVKNSKLGSCPHYKPPQSKELVYVKKWRKTSEATFFVLSNAMIQVYFRDHTEIMVFQDSDKWKHYIYIPKEGDIQTMSSEQATASEDFEF